MSDERPKLELDPRHTAIVVIDLQKGIALMPGGAPYSKPIVIANCVRLLSAARATGAQPVLVHVGGSPDGTDRLHTPTDQPMRSTGSLPQGNCMNESKSHHSSTVSQEIGGGGGGTFF